MFELLPGVGLRLPGRAGTLRLGADERTAQWAVATVADVRAGWVCGAGWSFTARYQGLELDALGDVVDRYGRYRDTPAWVASASPATRPPGPARRPVRWSSTASTSSATRAGRSSTPSATAFPDRPPPRRR